MAAAIEVLRANKIREDDPLYRELDRTLDEVMSGRSRLRSYMRRNQGS